MTSVLNPSVEATAAALNRLSLIESAQSDAKAVVLYSGDGADAYCVAATHLALERIMREPVQKCDASFFQNRDWIAKTKLVVVPGSKSTSQIAKALGPVGLGNIALATSKYGVAYLGICAGGFMVSIGMEFIINSIIEDIPLTYGEYAPKLFPGIARGPVCEGMNQPVGEPHIRSVVLRQAAGLISGNCYYNLGPYFRNAEYMSGVTILGHYDTYAKLPAIIHCTQNGVNAVLCGVHPEFSAGSGDVIGKSTAAHIDADFSRTVYSTMLTALGLFSGIETLPKEATCIIHSYLVDFPYSNDALDIPFLQFLPAFQRAETIELIRAQALSARLIRTIIVNGYTQFTAHNSTPESELLFDPVLPGPCFDIDKFDLLFLLDVPGQKPQATPQKVCDLVNNYFKKIVPAGDKYKEIEAFVKKQEEWRAGNSKGS